MASTFPPGSCLNSLHRILNTRAPCSKQTIFEPTFASNSYSVTEKTVSHTNPFSFRKQWNLGGSFDIMLCIRSIPIMQFFPNPYKCIQ